MNRKEILEYYSRPEILKHLIAVAQDREVCAATLSGAYTTRPDVLTYERDVLELVKQGAVSFHASVERWSNPMALATGKDLTSLRLGWDLVMDIDSSIGIEGAKLAAKRIIKLLMHCGVKNIGLKFSGNRGFHLSVSFEAFPSKIDFVETAKRYPEIPRAIAGWIRKKIEEDLLHDLIKLKGSVRELIQEGEIERLTPFSFVEIEQSWGSRHLFRMPFSLNEKTWLVSLPIKMKELEKFKQVQARPNEIKYETRFFQLAEPEEATELVIRAMDWQASKKKEVKISSKKLPKKKIPESKFPPCIRKILGGIPDGRKRSIFILVNFLRKSGWSTQDVEKKIEEWNKKNKPPLPVTYVRTQLAWFARRGELLPPNCDNAAYYQDFGVCRPDAKCKGVKNPVVYPFKK
jgi:DNA primase catalytic subunit